MEISFINLFNGIVVLCLLLPNIIWAVKMKNKGRARASGLVNAMEQLGRYASIVLMVVPLFVGKFGFRTVAEMVIWLVGSIVLVVAYWGAWIFYFKEKTARNRMALATIPCAIFLICGITLRHWALVIAAVIFTVAHRAVTENAVNASEKR